VTDSYTWGLVGR